MIDLTILFGKNLKYPIGEPRYEVGGKSLAAQGLVITPWNITAILRVVMPFSSPPQMHPQHRPTESSRF